MAPLSFPKSKLNILLLEGVHPAAVEALQAAGYTAITQQRGALAPEALAELLPQVHVLGIRSKTQLDAARLAYAERLWAVGAFCIGTDQIDLTLARRRGIAVFNAPFSSTRSVAELVIGALIGLMRRLYPKSVAAHAGRWDKSSEGCFELRGRSLGIVGYGHIGSQVSILAEAMGMRVLYYDILPKMALGNARAVHSLAELLPQVDALTLHVPEDASTLGMIDAAALQQMRPGALLINYARGRVLQPEALGEALRSGHLAGAALDVYPDEPQQAGDAFHSPLQGLENVLLSPHIGGSTEQAQERIGLDVAQKLIQYLDAGVTLGSKTLPELNLPRQAQAHRLLHIHDNVPGVASHINGLLAERGINLLGQYLKTQDDIGYVVLDVAAGQTPELLELLRQVPHTLRVRSLY